MTAEVEFLRRLKLTTASHQKQTIQSKTSFLTMKCLTVSVLNSIKKGPKINVRGKEGRVLALTQQCSCALPAELSRLGFRS